jgi:Peptidase M60, enhancin and enhancin-like/N-terminal domain of M60-like peptidases
MQKCASFYTNLIISLSLLFSGTTLFSQAPNGYTYCADENGTFTLPSNSHIAYGALNSFKFLFNQTGTITFDNETFGGDPIFGNGKAGYYKLADGSENAAALSTAIGKIKNHLTGTTPLTPTQINVITNEIQQTIFVISDTSAVILDAFDLVDYYENMVGPIFIIQPTQGGFPNEFGINDGFELIRAIFVVQQGIMDYLYTPQNFEKYKSILAGRKFKTADHFPGICPAPVNPLATFTAKINGSMPTEYGTRTAFSSTPARRPTGYYLAPGSLGKVTVPASMIDKGFKILVGAHTFERTGSNPCRRFFRVTNTFPITQTTTEIANPFGGGIYIITPYEANEGIVNIELTNVVAAPFFSAKTFDTTTLQEWLEIQRKNPAPWADFESDKYMMQVPTSWIYNYADPVTLMADWDNRMDIVSKMLGYPPVRSNTMLYLQIDVDIMFGGYGIGNPQINNTYNPAEVENGNKNHWFLNPGVEFWETEFHEMGHAQLFSNFPGEGEAAVNLLAAAIYNRLYDVDIDVALGESFDNHPYITRDQAALNWMVTPNFRAGNPMDISNTTKDEVRYQQRGYAKYVEMAALFGWSVIDSFYKKEQLDFIAQMPPNDGLTDVDSRIFRFSKTAGFDMRPLIHFWGVHPDDAATLKTSIQQANLPPSKLICDRLTYYKSIIPVNNSEFTAHANAFFGGSVPSGGDPDYGSGWYNIWLPLYNTTHGIEAKTAMQNIIDLYFPMGCPTVSDLPIVAENSPILNITPNPTHDFVHITSVGNDISAMQIIDNLGRVILEDLTPLKDGETRILNLTELPPSNYFIKISGEGFNKTVPLVKM